MRRYDLEAERLKTGRLSGDRDRTTVETSNRQRPDTSSPITEDPLEELSPSGRAMLEQVRIGLGFVPDTPTRLGRFVLGRSLGSGGMGQVHLAHDPKLGREVAIKRIRSRPYVSSKTLRDRLAREGRALASLSHPNVLHVYDLDEHEGEVFLAMEYVPGQTLAQWQREPERALADILRAYVEAGKGIAAAHAAQIIHRDFKPENVLVSGDDRVRVGDFGLAALLREFETSEGEDQHHDVMPGADRLTQDGELLGTVPYMSPERLRGESGDERSDQFSFCVALWEALTGALPFAGDEETKLPDRIVSGQLREGNELPRWLRLALKRGLAPEPQQRFPDMAALVASLERGLGRRKRWLIGAAVMAAAAVAGALGLAYGLSKHPDAGPCALTTALEKTPEPSEWTALRRRLGADAARVEPLKRHLESLTRQAKPLCQPGNAARLQQSVTWLDDLQRLLTDPNSLSHEALLEYIDWLSDRRLNGPPPKPLGEEVVKYLSASEASELQNDLDAAFDQANQALELSVWDFEKATALLRRGRVRALQGDGSRALKDYQAALHAADRSRYDDARLQATVLAAELALTRLEDLETGGRFLDDSEAISVRLHEPALSPRLARQDELRALQQRRLGKRDAALRLQSRALLRRTLAGDPPHLLARSLEGMAIIAEARGDAALAERCYREALTLLPEPSPERFQVAYLLGRWVAEQVMVGDPEASADEARQLLREAIDGRAELRVAAISILLRLEIVLDEQTPAVVELRGQLDDLLDAGAGTPTQRYEAWQSLAWAFAAANDAAQLERATREVYTLDGGLPPDPLRLGEFDLTIAGFLTDSETSQRYLASAQQRLESAPPSEMRDQMLDAVASFGD